VEYTAIGDTTNTASRVEAISKTTAHQLLFTDATRRLLRDPPAEMVFVDEFEIPGRLGRVELWSLDRSSNGEEPVDLMGSSHGLG
jgi:adenylate cyclase